MKKSLILILCLAVLASVLTSCGLFDNGDADAKDAAEKYLGKQVYAELGLAPERYDSKVIFKDGNKRLIVVKYSLENSADWGGSICVYTSNNIVLNATTINGPEFEYEERLNELRAMFGV